MTNQRSVLDWVMRTNKRPVLGNVDQSEASIQPVTWPATLPRMPRPICPRSSLWLLLLLLLVLVSTFWFWFLLLFSADPTEPRIWPRFRRTEATVNIQFIEDPSA